MLIGKATVIIGKPTEEILKQLNDAEDDWKGIRSDAHIFINPLEAVRGKSEIESKLGTIRLR